MLIYNTQRFRCCSRKSNFSLDSLDSIIKPTRVGYFIMGESVMLLCVYLCNAGNCGCDRSLVGVRGTVPGTERPFVSAHHRSELSEDELSVINNHLSATNCKWQSRQGSGISRELLTLHDCAQVLVPPVNSEQRLEPLSPEETGQGEPCISQYEGQSFLAFLISKWIKEGVGPII